MASTVSAAGAGVAGAASTPLELHVAWSALTPPAGPPPLKFASAAYDSDNDTMVVFGGVTSTGSFSNDTWVWNGSTWTHYPGTQTQAPPAREMASMAYDPSLHQLILFGGLDANGQGLSDTWAWNGLSWYEELSPVTPSPRYGAAFAYDGTGQLVLFGGATEANWLASGPNVGGSPTAGSTTVPVSSTTTSTTTTTVPATGPVSDLDDTWLWTSGRWVQAKVAGPPARQDAAAAFDSTTGQVVVFSGSSTNSTTGATSLLSDTWTWNGSAWTKQVPKSSPPSRTGAVAADQAAVAGMLVSGGAGATGTLADTWVWTAGDWLKALPATGPSARTGAVSAYDEAMHKVVVFGGAAAAGTALGDMWTLTAELSAATMPPTTAPAKATKSTPTTRGRTTTATTPGISLPTVTVPSSKVVQAPIEAPLSASVRSVHPGQLVTLSGSGFVPGTAVVITFHSTPQTLGHAVADGGGRFTARVAVPSHAPPGRHHFEATGSAPSGRMTELIAAVTVLGGSSSSDGRSVQTYALVAIAVLLPVCAWLGMLGSEVWRRRRRQAPFPAG